ncbi:hypothetical protein [Nocardioides sp. CFH 31398]|uniref:hypothetical protein n=1 Tax=Nocardioides sp. CFH 31398 TaxID=2919579 RepID=UPI001F06C5AD|nr:hypothetical protein [Nocardioides sp. CFH 31398]MCH1865802.1 hypothetical protein [Nocardioides sp. CFH 31398]
MSSTLLAVGAVVLVALAVAVWYCWQVHVTGDLEGWPDKAEERDGPPELHPDLRAGLQRYERWRARRR